MNRTEAQALLAELAWKRGMADGTAAAGQPESSGGPARPGPGGPGARIPPEDLRDLARQAGAPQTPAGSTAGLDSAETWEKARDLAAEAYAAAYASAARGERDAVSEQMAYLPGWPVGTGSRNGYLAGPATMDGHPYVLFDDGTQEPLPRAAIGSCTVFLIAEDTAPAAVLAVADTGDIVIALPGRAALAVSAGKLVDPDPDLAGPGTPHVWSDLLTAGLMAHHLASGRTLETFADPGYDAALEARDRAQAVRTDTPRAGRPFDGVLAAGRFLEENAPALDADAAGAKLGEAARAAGLLQGGPRGAAGDRTGTSGEGQRSPAGCPSQSPGSRAPGRDPELG